MFVMIVKAHFYLVLMYGTLVRSNEYTFDVFPVEKCPQSKEEWDARSDQLKCNITHGYHCVPNKHLTSLIEFCYPRGVRIPFEKGNCLELAGWGTLNQVSCKTFVSGCPDSFFFSQDLYKYQKCLAINTKLRCFDANFECIYSRMIKNKTGELNIPTTEKNQKENLSNDGTSTTVTALVIVIAILVIVISIGIFAFIKWRKDLPRWMQTEEEHMDEAHLCLLKAGNLSGNDRDISLEKPDATENTGTLNHDLLMLHDAIVRIDEKQFEHILSNSSINKHLLEKTNHRGLNSLHLAARNNNLNILKSIISLNVDVKSTAIDGRNSLHIAAYYGNHKICNYILENHKELFSHKDRYNMNPAHWAALGGQEMIIDLMMKFNCNVAEKTLKYEENLILFACMSESLSVCQYVHSRKEIAYLLHAVNSEGWNSIQYAAKSGNPDVFKFLTEQNVEIRNKSRQTGKNCLQTACEKGNLDVCMYILEKAPDLINERNNHGLHAGHFVAKSGDVEILQLLIKETPLDPDGKSLLLRTTRDNINILHIACKHARYDMCVAIADKFPELINQITEKGWNAALFITEKSGAEKDRIACLMYLEKHGLNVYHVSRSGKTILYNACVNRSTTLVKFLLKYYPDLHNIEKSMNPRKAARSKEIEDIFVLHMDDKMNQNVH